MLDEILKIGDRVRVSIRIKNVGHSDVTTSRIDLVTAITSHPDGYKEVTVIPTSIREINR